MMCFQTGLTRSHTADILVLQSLSWSFANFLWVCDFWTATQNSILPMVPSFGPSGWPSAQSSSTISSISSPHTTVGLRNISKRFSKEKVSNNQLNHYLLGFSMKPRVQYPLGVISAMCSLCFFSPKLSDELSDTDRMPWSRQKFWASSKSISGQSGAFRVDINKFPSALIWWEQSEKSGTLGISWWWSWCSSESCSWSMPWLGWNTLQGFGLMKCT